MGTDFSDLAKVLLRKHKKHKLLLNFEIKTANNSK